MQRNRPVAPSRWRIVPGLIPSFFASGVPEYPAILMVSFTGEQDRPTVRASLDQARGRCLIVVINSTTCNETTA